MGDTTQTPATTAISDMPNSINIILKVSENDMTLDVIKYLVVLRNMSHVGILSIVNNDEDEGVNPDKLETKLKNNDYHFLKDQFATLAINYSDVNNISQNLCVICKPDDTTFLFNKIRGTYMNNTDYPVIIEYDEASDLETLIFGLITCFTKDSVMKNLDKDRYNKLYKADKNLKISLLENEISITDSKFKIKKGDNMVDFTEDMNNIQNNNANIEFKKKITKNKERLRLLHKIAENASDLYSTIDSNKLKLNKQVTVLISTIKQNATSDKKNQYHILEMAELEQSPVSTSGGGRRIEAAKQKFRNLKTRLRGLIKGKRTTKKGNVKYTGHEGNVQVKTKFITTKHPNPNNATTAVINKLQIQKTTRADKYTIGVYYNNFKYTDKNKSISFIFYNLTGLKLIKFMLFNNVGAPVINIIKAIVNANAKYLPIKSSGSVHTPYITNVNNPKRDPHKIDKYESTFADLCRYVVKKEPKKLAKKLAETEFSTYVEKYNKLGDDKKKELKPLLKDLLNYIQLLEDLTIKYLVTILVYGDYPDIPLQNSSDRKYTDQVLYYAIVYLNYATYSTTEYAEKIFNRIKKHNVLGQNDKSTNYADVFKQTKFQELFNKLKNLPSFMYYNNIYIQDTLIQEVLNQDDNITTLIDSFNNNIIYFKLLSVIMDNSMTYYKKICTYDDNMLTNPLLRLPVLTATDTDNTIQFSCDSIINPTENKIVKFNDEISYVLEKVNNPNSTKLEPKIIVMCKISNQYEIKTDRTHKNPIISFVIPNDYNELIKTIYIILVGVLGIIYSLVYFDKNSVPITSDMRLTVYDLLYTQLIYPYYPRGGYPFHQFNDILENLFDKDRNVRHFMFIINHFIFKNRNYIERNELFKDSNMPNPIVINPNVIKKIIINLNTYNMTVADDIEKLITAASAPATVSPAGSEQGSAAAPASGTGSLANTGTPTAADPAGSQAVSGSAHATGAATVGSASGSTSASGGSLSRKKQPRKLRSTKKRLYPKRK